jgi:hypothetical protein
MLACLPAQSNPLAPFEISVLGDLHGLKNPQALTQVPIVEPSIASNDKSFSETQPCVDGTGFFVRI